MINQFKKSLVIAPHLDDETIALGGTIRKLSRANMEVNVIIIGGHLPPLYNKKDYQDESNKIITLIDKYSSKKLENIKILDYGCGTGNHLFYFKRYTKNLFGYDKSKSMIKIAKQKDINKSISFHSSNSLKLLTWLL